MTKLCPGCLTEKPTIEFASNKFKVDGLQSYCRLCKSKVDKTYYEKNKQEHYQKVRRYAIQNRLRLWRYLSENPCVDCGENDPVVLELDHKGSKSLAISNMISRKFSWSSIEKEIGKYTVRCSNCHRKKTASELG